jgi:phosphatidylglycerol:prolipoprotein diacylglycerol transferase
MLPYPKINPNIIEIGPIEVRWYGLMYVLGFLASYFLIGRQRRARLLGLEGARRLEFIIFLSFGLIVGARLGDVVLFQSYLHSYYLYNPIEIIAVWHGGMSFHGGLIGSVLACILFSRIYKLPFWDLADVIIVTVPVGLFLGRLGNFINGELYGRPSTLPWAMVFPAGGPQPRHPSQLYEAFLEGVVLFIVLWTLKDRFVYSSVVMEYCAFWWNFSASPIHILVYSGVYFPWARYCALA